MDDYKEINRYSENKYTLVHSWYIDDFGFKRNSMQVEFIRDDGMKMIYPFFAPFRATEGVTIGDDIKPFKGSEYADMLREQVKKIEHYG